jgi:hypothetical protein
LCIDLLLWEMLELYNLEFNNQLGTVFRVLLLMVSNLHDHPDLMMPLFDPLGGWSAKE